MNGSDSDDDSAGMAYFLPIGIADDSPPKRRYAACTLCALSSILSLFAFIRFVTNVSTTILILFAFVVSFVAFVRLCACV